MTKEALPEVLKYLALHPKKNIEYALEELNLKPLAREELRKIIEETLKKGLPPQKTYRIIMSKVRGRAKAGVVKKLLESMEGEVKA
jgi:Glu-tRNA(Gln) amidotransferase subunit E-like FAD-binding protein